MDKEKAKQKINEKDKARKKYLEELELLKQSFGVEFLVSEFKNNDIDKIKFYNLKYKNSVKNVVIIYDRKLKKFNYLSYEYDLDKDIKGLTNFKIIDDINSQYKLKILVDEIEKVNGNYKLKLLEIESKCSDFDTIIGSNTRTLEITKKDKKK